MSMNNILFEIYFRFKATRVNKHPLEYDILDSDDENKNKSIILIYLHISTVRHQSQKTGIAMKIEDIEIPEKMKEEEIAELFE